MFRCSIFAPKCLLHFQRIEQRRARKAARRRRLTSARPSEPPRTAGNSLTNFVVVCWLVLFCFVFSNVVAFADAFFVRMVSVSKTHTRITRLVRCLTNIERALKLAQHLISVFGMMTQALRSTRQRVTRRRRRPTRPARYHPSSHRPTTSSPRRSISNRW